MLAFIALLTLHSCFLLERGKVDVNGQYVPKRERFKLKDKIGVFPLHLDTVNIYKLEKSYYDNVLIYPDTNSKEGFNSIDSYEKFYGKGRCLSFSLPLNKKIELEDLNPNNKYYSKDYYYSPNGQGVEIESFVYGDGYGQYIKLEYSIIENGEYLIQIYKKSKDVYKRVVIPKEWSHYYPIDW
ncbi:MAG: hypothetical protein ACPGSD_06180 [Flavobacteriales bacterium]